MNSEPEGKINSNPNPGGQIIVIRNKGRHDSESGAEIM